MIALSDKDAAEENDNDDQQWTPPVVTSVASTGEGVVDVAEAIDAHARWACEHGELTRRRLLRAVEEITSTLAGLLRSRLESEPLSEQVQQVAQEVATGRVDVHRAAERLWERVVDSGAR
jgi:Putative periplasmic protein kinase ArgK and related GTPases of G3E family